MALPILLDCDPGHDDAIAIVLALASPELDVKAITSSAGNQTPEKTLRNVLRMLTLLNRTDIPVAGGAVKPLMRELIIADNVHGESGLDGPALPEPAFEPQNCTAVELMQSPVKVMQSPLPTITPQRFHPLTYTMYLIMYLVMYMVAESKWKPIVERVSQTQRLITTLSPF